MSFNIIGSSPNGHAGGSTSTAKSELSEDLRYTNKVLIPFLALALVVVVSYFRFQAATATALLWAMGCLVAGATLGFLFGIPKVLQSNMPANERRDNAQPGANGAAGDQPGSQSSDDTDSYRQQVNTNLTEISDWLTKIIVGLGLINLAKIPPHLSSLADTMTTGLNPAKPGEEKAFAIGLILCFSILGFLFGYLYTRLFLAGAFSRADRKALRIEQQIQRESDQEAQAATGNLPTERQLAAAERVAQLSSLTDISVVRQQMSELAREYERIRAVMPPGDERTRKMEIIVTKMRTLALACYPLLKEFMKSESPGDRLAAVAMMQVKANPEHLGWLAERLGVEKPFIGYHAAVALLFAVRSLGIAHYQALEDAIRQARTALGKQQKGTDRDTVLQNAEDELKDAKAKTTPAQVDPVPRPDDKVF